MASNDILIDTLKLDVESNSSKAEQSIERLATSLLSLNKSLGKIGNSGGKLRTVFTSMANLSQLKMPDFSKTIEQLQAMSHVDLSNLSKKIKVNLDLSGMNAELRKNSSRVIESAIKDAFGNISTANLSQVSTSIYSISNAFASLKDVHVDESGIPQLVKTLKSLDGVSIPTSDLTILISILKAFATQDMSGYNEKINAFVDSLRKLGGVKVETSTKDIATLVTTLSSFATLDMSNCNDKITSFVNALSNLAKVKFDDSKEGLMNFIGTMREFVSIDFSGFNNKITSFVNALKNLAEVDLRKYSTRLNSFLVDIRKLTETDMSGFNSEITSFVKAIAKLLSVVNSNTSADQLDKVSNSIINLIQSVSNINVSGDLSNLVQGLGQLASKSSLVTRQTSGLTKQYSNFETSSHKISDVAKLIAKSFNDMLSVLKKVGSTGVSAIKGFVNKVKELSRHKPNVDGLNISFKSLLKTVLGFRGLTGVFNWLKESVSLGAEVTEIDHIVESVFGTKMSKYVDEWAENAIDKFGIAANSAKKYAGTLTAMFQSSNVALKDANTMAIKLTELAGDLSAFYNIDTETAYNKIKSGMAGMVRPLRDLGIDLTAATLKEYALAKGIEKSYTDMSQAEKVMLRYQYLMEQTTTQSGDFRRTNLSLANSMRTLKAYATSLATEFGAGLGAAIRHVVIWLNSLMKHLVVAAKYFRQFMETIFGKYKGGASGMAFDASAIEEADGYAADLSNSADDAAGGLEDATSAAKKLKDKLSVLPFDELNQLSKDTDNGKDSKDKITGIADGLGGYGDALADFLNFDEAEKEMTDFEKFLKRWSNLIRIYFKSHKWKMLGETMAQGLNTGIKKLYNLLNPDKVKERVFKWIDAFSRTFNSFINYLDFNTLGRTLGRGIDILVSSINRLIDPKTGINWKQLGRKLGDGSNGLIDEIPWDEIGKFFANKINLIWDIAYGFVTTFDWAELGDSLAKSANSFVDKIDFPTMADTISSGLNGIIDTVLNFLDDFDARDFGSKLGLAFKRMIDGVSWERLGMALANIWNEAWEFLKSFILQLGTGGNGLDVQSAIDEKLAIKNGKQYSSVKTIGTGLGNAIHNTLKGIIDNIEVGDMVESLTRLFAKLFEDVSTIFGDEKLMYDIGYKFGDTVGGVIGNTETAKKLSEAINSLTQGFLNLFTGAIKGLEKHWKEIEGSISQVIYGIHWLDLFGAVAPFIGIMLAAKIPKIIGFIAVKKVLEHEVVKLFGTVGSTQTVVSAGKGLFSGITKALGGAGVAGSVIALTIKATEELQKFREVLRGGNGFLTEKGGGFDSFISKLGEVGAISGDTADKLFMLKEQWESGESSDDSFFRMFAETLEKAGVNATQARNYMNELKQSLNLTEDQVSSLDSTINNLSDTVGNSQEVLDSYGISSSEAINKIKTAIWEAGLEGSDQINTLAPLIQTMFADLAGSEMDLGEALKNVIEHFGLTEESVSTLRENIDEKLGEGTFDALISATNKSKKATEEYTATLSAQEQQIGSVATTAESSMEKVKLHGKAAELAAENTKNYNDTMEKSPSIFSSLGTVFSGLVTTFMTSLGAKADFEGRAKENLSGFEKGIDDNKSDSIVKPLKEASEEGLSVFADETRAKASGGMLDTGVAKGIKEKVGDISTAIDWISDQTLKEFKTKNRISSPSKVYEEASINIPLGIAKGIKGRNSELREAIRYIVQDVIKKQFNTEIKSLISHLKSRGGDIAWSIPNGFDSVKKQIDMGQRVRDLFGQSVINAINTLSNDFYGYGQTIAQSLANGMQAVNLPKLKYELSSYNMTMLQGGGFAQLPNFSPKWWYAKGALFTRPSIVGVGEAGDEAALPLENKRTMSRIANAITENMSGVGIDEQELADAIAQGYMTAMMATQSQDTRDNVFNITVKTMNDEVLARAVQRGNKKLNYRNSPVAQN